MRKSKYVSYKPLQMSWEINPDFDYESSWRRQRPRGDFRFIGENDDETFENFIYQVADSTSWSGKYYDEELVDFFEKTVYRIVENIIRSNDYGWGKRAHDNDFSFLDDLWEKIQPKLNERLLWWRYGILQELTHDLSYEEVRTQHPKLVNFVFPNGFMKEDYDILFQKETERVRNYCEEESKWIAANSGYRGD